MKLERVQQLTKHFLMLMGVRKEFEYLFYLIIFSAKQCKDSLKLAQTVSLNLTVDTDFNPVGNAGVCIINNHIA